MDDNQVIIDVGLDGLIGSLQELQKQYEANREAIAGLDKESETYAHDLINLQQQNKALRSEMKGIEGQIQNSIKAERAQEESLVQLRAQLGNLNKQYDSMSGFDRMGEQGIALRDKIDGLTKKIGGLEEQTGRYQRNVGNYKSALEGLRGGFKSAGLATGGLDQSLKLLNGNPIVFFLTTIVSVIRSVIKSFKDNEEAMVAMKEAMAPLNPILDHLKRGFEAFAGVLVKLVGGAINGLVSAFGWLLEKAQAVGNFFGADWHMADNFKEAKAAAEDLAKSENEYKKAHRAWGVEVARIDRDVSELRAKAKEKDRYTARERLAFLNEAIALEEKKAEKEKEFAKWHFDILTEEAKRTANSTAVNDELAEAEAAVYAAEKALADRKRELSRERLSAIKEIKGETDNIIEQNEAIKRSGADLATMVKELPKLQDEIGKLDMSAVFNNEALKMSADEAESLMAQFLADYELYGEDFEKVNASVGASFSSLSGIYKSIADDESKTAEEREAAAKKAKVFALMNIAAESGTAIAKGISQAMSVPFPMNLAAMASTLAAVLAAIAQAKQAVSSFETGGVIGGYKGARMGRDDTYIHARSGEMVINANQQKRLFEIANGHTGMSQTAALVHALSAMPPPVLEYREFKSFTDRVVSLDEGVKLS